MESRNGWLCTRIFDVLHRSIERAFQRSQKESSGLQKVVLFEVTLT
jgi:hypothetical protein